MGAEFDMSTPRSALHSRASASPTWSQVAASPWSPDEVVVSPSLDGYIPFGAERPQQRRPLRPLKHANTKKAPSAVGKASAPTERTAELTLLGALRASAAEAFEPARHHELLRRAWTLGSLGPADAFQAVSPCWRTLGFRRDDPSIDLKGCGALGLRHLAYFLANQGGARAALQSDAFPHSPFPLAVASLNVTLALCHHLHLLPMAASSRPPCAEPTLAHFLRFSASLEPASALDLMHAECLRGLCDRWAQMQQPGLTPLHFTEALHLLTDHLAEALAGAQPPWQPSEVLMRLRAFDAAGGDEGAMGDLCVGQAVFSLMGLFG